MEENTCFFLIVLEEFVLSLKMNINEDDRKLNKAVDSEGRKLTNF